MTGVRQEQERIRKKRMTILGNKLGDTLVVLIIGPNNTVCLGKLNTYTVKREGYSLGLFIVKNRQKNQQRKSVKKTSISSFNVLCYVLVPQPVFAFDLVKSTSAFAFPWHCKVTAFQAMAPWRELRKYFENNRK